MESTAPSGPRLPTPEAIDILNQNARAASERSRYATAITAQGRIGRDALRRDFTLRQADPSTQFGAVRAVPQDRAPAPQQTPIRQLTDLLAQFSGSGQTTGSGGGVGRRSGTGSGSGSGGSPTGGATRYDAGGVQTFYGDPGATVTRVIPQTPTAPAAPSGTQAVISFQRLPDAPVGGSGFYQAVYGSVGPGEWVNNPYLGITVKRGVGIPNVPRSHIRR
jgi:hypothetical protein